MCTLRSIHRPELRRPTCRWPCHATQCRPSSPDRRRAGLALVFGLLAVRLRLPALVGYLLAGVVIGPFTQVSWRTTSLAGQLGNRVMLLMFGVGLHFSLDDLLSVKKNSGGSRPVVQDAVCTAMGWR